MAKEKILIAFKVTEEQKKEYQNAAKQLGLSLSAFVKMGADLVANFDPAFVAQIEEYAKSLKLDVSLVLSHLILRVAAHNYAWLVVFGKAPPGSSREFRFEKGKLLTGDELSRKLFEEYKEIFENMTKNKKAIKVKGKSYAYWTDEEAFELFSNQ